MVVVVTGAALAEMKATLSYLSLDASTKMRLNLKLAALVAILAPLGCLTQLWIAIVVFGLITAALNIPIAPPADIREGFDKPITPPSK